MKNLRVALVVPNNLSKSKLGTHRKALLREKCHAKEIDLVIFPECFLDEPELKNAVPAVRALAEELRTPVLSGVSIDESYETAAFVNPEPGPSDTKEHLYVKHSSAAKLAYEVPGYQGRKDPMFQPIKISGHRLGVLVCHDMFFGLLPALYIEKGATGLVDLTGGNVQIKKWRNIAQARSIEVKGPFLCTMAKLDNPDLSGKAEAIAYCDGADIPPLQNHTDPDGTGGFSIFPLMIQNPVTRIVQDFSPRKYSDIRVSLGGSGKADIYISDPAAGIKISGTRHHTEGKWHAFDLPSGRVGVIALPLEAIFDPLRLYKDRAPNDAFTQHIAVYYDDSAPSSEDRVIAMARLRAIEHRIAVALMAGVLQEVIKTDKYKHIQRFQPDGDVFGLNKANLGGTYVTYSNAIPPKLFDKYLDLL